MTNSAGRPVFQQNALRRAGGYLYRPAGHSIIEIGPVIQNFERGLARGGGINMAGPPCDIWLKFCQILHCNAPDRWYNRITERGRDPKPPPRDARRG